MGDYISLYIGFRFYWHIVMSAANLSKMTARETILVTQTRVEAFVCESINLRF